MSDDIAAFIAARLDEDEATARAVRDNSAPWDGQWQPRGRHALETYNGWVLATAGPGGGDFTPGVVEHIARHDPARVLREVAAKRAILKEHASSGGMYPVCSQCVRREPGTWYGDEEDGEEPPDDESSVGYPCRTVRLLGAVYGDHADYRKEWAA